jgi:hypothetical protein
MLSLQSYLRRSSDFLSIIETTALQKKIKPAKMIRRILIEQAAEFYRNNPSLDSIHLTVGTDSQLIDELHNIAKVLERSVAKTMRILIKNYLGLINLKKLKI